jgi:DNA segregation ATPase FtsK/SpoIIIE-like protein
MTAVLGVTHDGAPLLIRLPSSDVGHVLITGGSGQGGAALLRTIAVSLVRENPASRLRMVMVNQDGSDFRGFGSLPHLARPVVGKALEAVEALESVERLMRRRARVASIPSYVVLFIDDLSCLLMKAGKRAEDALPSILQGGRRVGIHVVAAHTFSRPPLATTIRAAFPVRIVNTMTRMTGEGVLDVEAAARSVRLARAGQYATGDSRLAESDDFIALAQEDVVPFQAAHVDAEVIHGLCTTLRGAREQNWQAASKTQEDTVTRALGELTETSRMQPSLSARPSPGAPDARAKENGGRR